MASRSSTVIISSSPIAKVGGLLTLTIAASNGTRLPFSFASVPLAPKYDSHPFGGLPPNLVSTMGDTGSLLFYTKQLFDAFVCHTQLLPQASALTSIDFLPLSAGTCPRSGVKNLYL